MSARMAFRSGFVFLVVLSHFVVLLSSTTSSEPRLALALQQNNECLDEAGAAFTKGGLRKVGSQIQECDGGGKWIAGSKTAVPAHHLAGEFCKAPKDQQYEPGLLHAVGSQFERCDNGKWTPVVPDKPVLKPCSDDSGKTVPSGSIRSLKGQEERCTDGKWVSKN